MIIPAEEQGRQAVASLRGYAYQIIASALAWTELKDDELLLLEVAEDFSILSEQALGLRQSKDTAASGSVTLRSSGVVGALNALWRFRAANHGRRVSLAYLTTSQIGHEQGVEWPGGLSGLAYWRDAAREGVALENLRTFLLTLDLDADLKLWLIGADDETMRAELVRVVRWECGEPPIGELENLLQERLVLLCDHLGAPASTATALRSLAVVELLHVATQPDPQSRRRSRARLLELAEQATSVSLPLGAIRASLGLGSRDLGVGTPLVRLDALPSTHWSVQRPVAEDRLHAEVRQGTAWLMGASGTGKTTLARSLVQRSNQPWFVIDLRDLSRTDVVLRLRAARQALAAESNVAGLVLDDLPISCVAAAKHELALTAVQLGRANASLLITAYNSPPPSLIAELDLRPEAVLEAPYFEEDEVASMVEAAGGDPQLWARPVHLFCGGGHVQLVAARISGLRARGWPRAELLDGLQRGDAPRDVEAEREGVRQRLIDELPAEARTLLFRLSALGGAFDRDLGMAVGASAPPLSQAGAILDLLTGPWLEPRPNAALRVSPLVQGAAGKVMSAAETRAVNIAVADELVRRNPFPGDQLPQLLLSSLLTGHEQGFQLLAMAALSPDLSKAQLRNALFPLVFLATDKPIVATQPGLNRMLRLAQLKVAALGDDADRIDAIFRRFLKEAQGVEGEALQRGSAAFLALSADKAPIPPVRWFEYLLEAERTDFSEAFGPPAPEVLPEPVKGEAAVDEVDQEGPITSLADPAAALFTLRVGNIHDIDELEALFKALDALEAERRRRYLDGLPEPYVGRRMMLQLAWLHSSEQPGFDGRGAADRFGRLLVTAESWGDLELAKECLACQAVLLAEYADDNNAALALLKAAEARWPDEARIRRERAKIHFRQGRFAEVLREGPELLRGVAGSEPVERTHVTREVALAAGESGDLKQAIHLFLEAEAVADEAGALADMKVGLAADRALLIWRDGRKHEALTQVRDALLAIEGLDKTTKRGEYLVRAISIVIRVMYQDLTSPGWDAGLPSVLGIASRPPRDWTEGPVPTVLSGWYQLHTVERFLGDDVGIAALLLERTKTSKIVTCELIKASTEYLRILQTGPLVDVVGGLSTFARSGAYARSEGALDTEDDLPDDLFAEVETLPWDGSFDPSDPVQCAFVMTAIASAAAFAFARGEVCWFARFREITPQEPKLADFVSAIVGDGEFEKNGPGAASRLWALQAIHRDALAADDLAVASVRIWEWLGDTFQSRELAKAVCPTIAQQWRRIATEARFSLKLPLRTAPAIMEAAEAIQDRVALGRLILTAFNGIAFRPAPELLAQLQGQSENPHRASDAFSIHVGQQD